MLTDSALGGVAGVMLATGQLAADPVNELVQVTSIWDFLIKGGPVMVPILIGSLAALTVVVERLLVARRVRVIPPGFLDKVRVALGEGPDAARACCQADASPIARVLAAGLKRMDEPAERREKAIEEAGGREVYHLRRGMRLLAMIATLAPVLGLLGTIFGMIKAFQTVALSGEAMGKTELLAKGIYEALITTAAGLLLAIPVLLFHHLLTARIERLVREMDRVTVEFFEDSEQNPRRDAPAGQAVRTSIDGDGHTLLAAARG